MQISDSTLVQRIGSEHSRTFIFGIEFGIELGNLWCRVNGSEDSVVNKIDRIDERKCEIYCKVTSC